MILWKGIKKYFEIYQCLYQLYFMLVNFATWKVLAWCGPIVDPLIGNVAPELNVTETAMKKMHWWSKSKSLDVTEMLKHIFITSLLDGFN